MQYHIRQWKDVQDQGDRQWYPETQPGWRNTSTGKIWGEKGKTIVSPGKDPRYLNLTLNRAPVDWKVQSIEMPTKLLDNSVLEVTVALPQAGPVWISVDAEFTMYYSQENSTPFEYTKPWVLTIHPDDALIDVGNWLLSYMDATSYHARLIGQVNARVVRALRPFRIGIGFRCGTSTAKGQWLFTAVRCEAAGGLISAGTPIELEAAGSAEAICAGEDEGFVVLEPDVQ